MADEQIQELRVRNDQICEELGLPKFQKDEQRQSRGMSNAEYYTAVKGCLLYTSYANVLPAVNACGNCNRVAGFPAADQRGRDRHVRLRHMQEDFLFGMFFVFHACFGPVSYTHLGAWTQRSETLRARKYS